MFIIHPKTLTLGDQKAVLSITLDFGREQLIAPKTQLKLVIYDFDLYDQDQLAKADAGNVNDFEIDASFFTGQEGMPGGPRRRLVLPPQLSSPKADPGTGVLAVVDFNLHRVETKAELAVSAQSGAGQWYVNDLIGNLQTPSDSPFAIGLEMFAKRGDDGTFGTGTLRRQIIGRFGISKQDLTNIESPRLLALRLISPIAQGPLQPGTIVLSSLNPLDNRVGVARGLRSRCISLNIKAAQESLKRPGQPPPADTGTQPFTNRRVKPDLTGYYELQVEGVDTKSTKYIAPASLWIAQAGQALVGWYLPYDKIGFGRKFTGFDLNRLPLTERACIITAQSAKFPNDAFTFWCLDAGDERIDPDRLFVSQETPDPSNDVPVRIGDLQVLSSGGAESTVIEVSFNRRSFSSDAPSGAPIRTDDNATVGVFKRISKGARMPWAAVKQLEKSVKVDAEVMAALIRRHVEPLPSGWWKAFGARLAGPDMARAIVRFSKFRDTAVIVQQEFDNVGKQIDDLLSSFPSAQYRNEGLSVIQNLSNTILFPGFDGIQKSLQAWIIDIGETHLNFQMEKARTNKPDGNLTPEEQEQVRASLSQGGGGNAMRDLGALGGDEFEYEFQFSAHEISLNVLIGAAVGGFVCVVTRRSKSAPKTDYSLPFLGAFVGVSGAFGVKFAVGKAASGPSGGTAPVSCKIKSFQEIEATDWSAKVPPPTFSVAAVFSGLSGTLGPLDLQTALSAASTLFAVHVPRRKKPTVHLSAIVESAFEWDAKVPDLKEFLEGVEKGEIASVSAALAGASESFGTMVLTSSVKGTPPPDPKLPIIPDQVVPTNPTVNAPFVAFEKNDSRLQPNLLIGLDRRLAMYRYLFEVGGWYLCSGFSSPEFKARNNDPNAANLVLSQNRAKAADDYITATFGLPGQGIVNADKEHRAPAGAGRGPSLEPTAKGGGGLHDPYAEGVSQADVQREEQTEYHKWRRVDIVVNATLAARIWSR